MHRRAGQRNNSIFDELVFGGALWLAFMWPILRAQCFMAALARPAFELAAFTSLRFGSLKARSLTGGASPPTLAAFAAGNVRREARRV